MTKSKIIILSLLLIGLVVGLYFFLNLFSLFLCGVIVFSLLFFLGIISSERIIDGPEFQKRFPSLDKQALNAKRLATYKFFSTFLGLTLLTLTFLASVYVLRKYQQPSESKPYFNNADYHAVSNIGVAFNQSLTLSTNASQPSVDGLWSNENGTFKARQTNNGGFELSFDHYFEPVFVRKTADEAFTPVNTIFRKSINNNFTISNDSVSVRCTNIKTVDEAPLWKRLLGKHQIRNVYSLTIRCDAKSILRQLNLSSSFEDEIEVTDVTLEKGKKLYTILIENDGFVSKKAQSKQVLERILQNIGDAYLLKNPNTENSLTFFPTNDFFENGYSLTVDGSVVSPTLQSKATIDADSRFFIGFYNIRKQYFFSAIDKNRYPNSTKNAALIFDFPQFFDLSAQKDAIEIGTKQVRFLNNHYTQLLNASSLKEGFLFHENLRNAQSNLFSGTMIYTINQAGVGFSGEMTDNFQNDQKASVFKKNFTLSSQDKNHEWLFHVRDFSANGFSLNSNLMYLSILFLLLVFTLLFNAGQKLERIEPIIFTVIYALLVYRFILLWRVATFPPLENISKYELENTLIQFDFTLGSFTLPVPLTFLVPALFIVFLNIYRWKKSAFEQLLAKYHAEPKRYLYFHIGLLLVCGLLLKIANFDLIVRIFGIFIPLVSYLFFSVRINQQTDFQPKTEPYFRNKILGFTHKFFNYLAENQEFYLTLATFVFFAIFDRGFGVLFLLFLLLKNIFVSFLRKPYSAQSGSRWSMFWQPNNYWIYGILSLFIYLLFIGYKPLFHKLLIHRNIILIIVIACSTLYLYLTKPKKNQTKILGIGLALVLVLAVPFSRNFINNIIDDQIKSVAQRASLIYQPIDDLIAESDYSSFKERKIIETAEGQWFINSYLNKTENDSKRIDFKPHFNRGVNYSTQTRDVVLPRYVIAEFGSLIVYLLLMLLAIPMLVHLMGFQLYQQDSNHKTQFAPQSYGGSIALIFVFTLGFFVWLASTNRFVFFGQDFPFLSLTSKLSLLLPLTLFFIPLLNQPIERKIKTIAPTYDFTRYGIFFGTVAVFLLVSGRSNNLREENFQITLSKTETAINKNLNGLFNDIQDTLRTSNNGALNKENMIPQDLSKILSILVKSDEFKALYDTSDTYSQSIFDILRKNPAYAFRQDSPIYIRYDSDRYQSVYNKHLYLELPPYQDKTAWKGNLYQESADSTVYPILRIHNRIINTTKFPFFAGSEGGTLKVAVLPATWFVDISEPIVLLNLQNEVKRKTTTIDIVSSQREEVLSQDISGFVNKFDIDELAQVTEDKKHFLVSFSKNNNHAFMSNYWVNGKQRMVYPMAEKLFWAYNYSNALKSAYNVDSLLKTNATVSLDYELNKQVHDTVLYSFRNKFKHVPNFKFAVMAADGDGKIRLMQDYVKNRKLIDPNNVLAIEEMNQKYFFFSNNKNERDQWGNTNLLHLAYGPGSSIKPLVYASIASQLNVGWEKLILQPAQASVFSVQKGDTKESAGQYAGYVLPKRKGWIDEHGEHWGSIGAVQYLQTSSNFYHSALLFLGSYHRDDFKKNNQYKIENALSSNLSDPNNQFPALEVAGVPYRLKSFKEKAWPRSSKDEKTYFGNEKSLLALGIDKNLGLIVEDIDKTDRNIKGKGRVDYADSVVYDKLREQQVGGFLWSFPEQSYFIQAERKHPNALTNFFNGLKNPTLGGTPYNVTPMKMTEMFGKMISQNKDYSLHLTNRDFGQSTWKIDSTWQNETFVDFMQQNVLEGMKQVLLGGGTASGLFGGTNVYRNYYCYAKTGTIKEGKQNDSKRLALIISQSDLTQTFGQPNKFYVVYFTANEADNQEWAVYRAIINQIIDSESFKNYMR
ncbi:hypothetical protein GCM10027035_10630 [Emticicia sediminis]